MSLVGCLQWAVTLNRMDIAYIVMVLSRFQSEPRQGHLNQVQWVCGYLCKHPDAKNCFRMFWERQLGLDFARHLNLETLEWWHIRFCSSSSFFSLRSWRCIPGRRRGTQRTALSPRPSCSCTGHCCQWSDPFSTGGHWEQPRIKVTRFQCLARLQTKLPSLGHHEGSERWSWGVSWMNGMPYV